MSDDMVWVPLRSRHRHLRSQHAIAPGLVVVAAAVAGIRAIAHTASAFLCAADEDPLGDEADD